jgi:hypothetical protein
MRCDCASAVNLQEQRPHDPQRTVYKQNTRRTAHGAEVHLVCACLTYSDRISNDNFELLTAGAQAEAC